MIKEIYLRGDSDVNFENRLEHSSDVETILTGIRMILGTRKSQVLGDYNFGTSLKDLIFTTRYNKDRIQDMIQSQIDNYIKGFPNYTINTDVKFGKLTNGSDYCIVDIYINQEKMLAVLVD